MKFVHLGDLHLGKQVHGFDMCADQLYILNEILGVIKDEKPNAVVIAGDVYDKSIPSVEATKLFDDFLFNLYDLGLKVLVISGNHDSADRLSFGSRLIGKTGINISPVYNGKEMPIVIEDEFGKTNFYMLPFVKPANVRPIFPNENIESYTDAIRAAVGKMDIDRSQRNVLVAHQFITGAERSDSEDISVGGLDNVDASVFSDFDYVALGHIHIPQNVTSCIRYCGSPLMYSFSETKMEKSVTVVELRAKGDMNVKKIPLTPKHKMVELEGTFDELMSLDFYRDTTYREDYVHITLTDEAYKADAFLRLNLVYKNLMKLDYKIDSERSRIELADIDIEDAADETLDNLFAKFYEQCNGFPLSDEQAKHIKEDLDKIEEDERK